MTKILHSEAAAREKLLNGVNAVSNHVKKTLGPKGRNIIIEQKYNAPKSTKDGVTVARSIFLEDPAENLGAQLVIQAAEKTVEQAGDGTTATCVLLQSIVKTAHRNITADANSIDIKRGIEYATAEVVKNLIAAKTDVTLDDEARLAQVASIAANGDEKLGALVARAMKAVGAEGITTVEESSGVDTEVELTGGMQFDRGYASQYFVNDPNRMECVLEEPLILLYDKKITNAETAIGILKLINEKAPGQPLLIIAEDVDGPALAVFAANNNTVVRGGQVGKFSICAVKGPQFGSRRRDSLGDIAVLSGGVLISEETGQRIENAVLGMFGKAEKVIISEDTTTIIGGMGTKESIEKRKNEIRSRLERSTEEYDKEKQQERLAKLSSGVAIIRVGGKTEVEMKELRDRVEDALMAAKSAVQEGIVPGGGIALLTAAKNIAPPDSGNSDFYNGIDIVRNACKEPFNQIIRNAGLEPAEILAEIKATTKSAEGLQIDSVQGYNAANDSYCDMISCGIIDSVKVIRCALENAASVAGQIILCEGTVHEKREPLQVLNNNPDEM